MNVACPECRSVYRVDPAKIPGDSIHITGVCRMGSNPNTSMLTSNCESHEIEGLYVTDGGAFPFAHEKNPTLTIMAVAMRAAEHLVSRLRRSTG